MSSYKIAWLPGDGVGIEVLEAAKICLDALKFDATYVHGDIGWEFWRREGDAFPQRTIDLLQKSHASLFGAITSKPVKDAERELVPELQGKGLGYRSPIVRMRQMFDLYTCLRPCKAYPGSPLNYREGIDLVVFRENTEDLYAGVEFAPVPDELVATLSKLSKPFEHFAKMHPSDYAVTCKINSKIGCERIIRAAFAYAKKFGYPKVTIIHKANVVRATEGMFLETGKRIAKEYPGIQMDDANIDAICMWLLKNPKNYGVLVATNMFGDIVSDLAAQMVGGLGFGCSGNIGEKLAVFEPTHGSAPKYAGLYKVNPIATILAAKMMLDWLGETDKGDRLEKAVAAVIAEGKVRTYDMCGSSTTLEMSEAIAREL
jgi:isocitrate/isopropylmalate dehydrogenase